MARSSWTGRKTKFPSFFAIHVSEQHRWNAEFWKNVFYLHLPSSKLQTWRELRLLCLTTFCENTWNLQKSIFKSFQKKKKKSLVCECSFQLFFLRLNRTLQRKKKWDEYNKVNIRLHMNAVSDWGNGEIAGRLGSFGLKRCRCCAVFHGSILHSSTAALPLAPLQPPRPHFSPTVK